MFDPTGIFESSISIKKPKFSPDYPEISSIFDQLDRHDCLFYIYKSTMKWYTRDDKLHVSLFVYFWVDGLAKQVNLQVNTIPEIIDYPDKINIAEDDGGIIYVYRQNYEVLEDSINNLYKEKILGVSRMSTYTNNQTINCQSLSMSTSIRI